MQNAAHTSSWVTYTRRCLLILGAISALCVLVACYLYARGYWQWRKDGEAIESPSQRYAVSPAVIVYPRLKFGLVMSDREQGKEEVVAGWTRNFPWHEEIKWTADDRLRIEYHDQNSLRWGQKTELFGVKIDWVLVPEGGK